MQPLNEPALDAWILATAADAVVYATSLLRDRSAAEDVVQDCYCRLLAKAGVYNLPRDGRKLLFEAITNASINRLTRARPLLSLDTAGDDGESLHGAVADPEARSPERLAMNRELELAIGAALEELPPVQRAALQMKSLGHSLEEIGSALGVTSNHAGVLIHRARQTMARLLAPYLAHEKTG
jgi:RNA polymerase sigma factor (sigma-70 family)